MGTPTGTRPLVIAIVSDKGGVGKTTLTVHLGLALSQRGVRILVIDLDHQGAASALLRASPEAPGAAELLGLRPPAPAMSLHEATQLAAGLDIVCSSVALRAADLVLAPALGRERRLADALERAAPDRGLLLIDTPASLGLLTINALVAADYVLTPVQAAYLSLMAVPRVEEIVAQVQRLNPRLQQLGYIFSMVDNREGLVPRARELAQQRLGPLLWKSEIRIDATLKAEPGMPVRRRHAAVDFEAAATELLDRLPALQRALISAPQLALQ